MTLKQLTGRLIFPLSVILFGTITKWWWVLPVDAPDTMMFGFPLPFICEGWHTSMSLQFFMLESLFDLLVYFSATFLLVFLVDRFLLKIQVPGWLTRIVWIFATILFSIGVFIASNPDHIFTIKRDWKSKVAETGFKFTWTQQDRPDVTSFDADKK
jgi:hypothetical protein